MTTEVTSVATPHGEARLHRNRSRHPVATLVLGHGAGGGVESRLDELEGVGVPTLIIQGERDTFGTPEEFPERFDMTVVPGADHGFKVPKSGPVSQDDALMIIVEATLEWVVREVVGNQVDA